MPHTARHGGDDDGSWSGNEGGDDSDSDSIPSPAPDTNSGDEFTLPSVLSTFVSNPRRFILGALLTTLLDGLFGVASIVIKGIQIALGTLASLPTLVGDALTDAGGTIGTDIYQVVVNFNDPIFNAADTAGPLAPVLVALVVVTETAIVLVIGERAIRVVIDVIPGGGGLV